MTQVPQKTVHARLRLLLIQTGPDVYRLVRDAIPVPVARADRFGEGIDCLQSGAQVGAAFGIAIIDLDRATDSEARELIGKLVAASKELQILVVRQPGPALSASIRVSYAAPPLTLERLDDMLPRLIGQWEVQQRLSGHRRELQDDLMAVNPLQRPPRGRLHPRARSHERTELPRRLLASILPADHEP